MPVANTLQNALWKRGLNPTKVIADLVMTEKTTYMVTQRLKAEYDITVQPESIRQWLLYRNWTSLGWGKGWKPPASWKHDPDTGEWETPEDREDDDEPVREMPVVPQSRP